MQTVLMLALLAATIASAISVVWARHEGRVLFVQLTALQNERDAINIDYGRLELEQATFAEPRRIDEEARQQLGMVDPSPQNIRLLRR
ncbi:cell division protein FtsL [Rhodanobacter sp. DHG33]|uniref:cell division protein FtsL n=1 Tax=Rhodanobacter sp. DHG33 TaxID=2775921 RepID=UPI00177ED1C9|nr:cell division protein FtsL [Rhodanobacter sp. DHG33]